MAKLPIIAHIWPMREAPEMYKVIQPHGYTVLTIQWVFGAEKSTLDSAEAHVIFFVLHFLAQPATPKG